MSYLLPLAAIGAIGYVIKGFLFPIDAVLNSFLMQAVVWLLATTISYYISANTINMLAPTFKKEKVLYLIVAFLVIITLYMFIAFILGAILLSLYAVTSSAGMFN